MDAVHVWEVEQVWLVLLLDLWLHLGLWKVVHKCLIVGRSFRVEGVLSWSLTNNWLFELDGVGSFGDSLEGVFIFFLRISGILRSSRFLRSVGFFELV